MKEWLALRRTGGQKSSAIKMLASVNNFDLYIKSFDLVFLDDLVEDYKELKKHEKKISSKE